MLEKLEAIHSEILKCKMCPLYKYARNKVPGEGDPSSGIVFIGEAPGKEEDIQGRPFVGKAGKLLTRLIEEKLEIKRSNIYITNVLKCRPPGNRDPLPEEIEKCSTWLKKQLDIIKPKVIITLGRFSAKWIFDYFGLKFTKISEVRGNVYRVKKWGKEVIIIPTYHPAAALYHNNLLPILEKDFERIREEIFGNSKGKTLLEYLGFNAKDKV